MTNETVKENENLPAKADEKPVVKVDHAQAFVDKLKQSWESVLPSVCTPDRFARVALTCIRKNNKLGYALQSPTGRVSLAECFMQCAELGIEPDGRRAYLIPYSSNIQLIIDYKGIAELAMRSGKISNIHADKVCDNDEFEYNVGVIEKHKIDFKKERGNPYAYYSIVTFKDGTKKCEVMSKEEVDAIRKRSKSANNGPWVSDYDEMAKKTVFRRLSKWLPLSPELQKVWDIDDKDFTDKPQVIDNPMDNISDEDRYKSVDFDPETGEIIEAEKETQE